MKIFTKSLFILTVLTAVLSCSKGRSGSSGSQDLMNRDDAVKYAQMTVESDNPDAIRKNVYSSIGKFDAKVTSEYWSDNGTSESSGSLEIEVPSSEFLGLVNWLRDEFHVSSMSLNAREQNKFDEADGNVKNGTAYSTIYLRIERTYGFGDSFLQGLTYAGIALKFSLVSITPVIFFLLPYAVIVLAAVFLVKFLRRKLKKKAQ